MTESDKALQLGNLHLELQRNRQKLGCLASQAKQLQDSLRAAIRDLNVDEVFEIPPQIVDIKAGAFLTEIRITISRIRQIEMEIKNITPDFQPAPLPQ